MPDYPYGYELVEGRSVVSLAAVESMCAVHWPEGAPPCRVVDGLGREIAAGRLHEGVTRPYAGPVVEHYWSKSFLEYVVKKRRGEALALESGLFRRGWLEYFEWTAHWVQAFHCPIAPGWIARVAAEAASILARPAVGAAYAEVVRQYWAMTDVALEDGGLFRLYMDHMNRVSPQFR